MRKNAVGAAILIGAALGGVAGFTRLGGAQEITPRPTPTAVICARPNVRASVVQAAPAVVPPLAQQQGIHGTVQVIVSLDPDSRVVGARIYSSPSAVLNQAALAAARQTTYQTEINGCRAIAADFVYSVDFANKVTFATASSGERTVSVIGQGTATRPADAAVVRATIVTRDATAETALAKNDALLGTLKGKLSALGIGERKITWTLSVRPRFSTTPEPASEYIAARQVEIAVDAVANAGHAAAAVASLASVDAVAIRYALNEHAAADREALDSALKDAENTARDAVNREKLRLGVLREVVAPPGDRSRPSAKTVPYYLVPITGGFKEPDISVPELEVRVTATVTYAIKP
jgi:TonB family protein